MEQIIVTKPDGSFYPLQNKATVTHISQATQTIALLGEDVVNITIESPVKQTYGIGDTITVYNRKYKLNRLPKMKKTGTHEFVYDLEFEGLQYDLMRATYDLTIETTTNTLQDVQADSLTGNLNRFATVLIANINRIFPGKWQLGTCPTTIGDKTLTFGESDNCLSVLQTLCNEFETEFEIDQSTNVNIINLKKIGQIFPYPFEYGKGRGLYELDRQNVSSANIVTRLKVYGANKNITSKYRAQRLCLPAKSKGLSYIENPAMIAKYGVWENTKYFDDIYPKRTGTVTALGANVLTFVDSAMFDLNEKEQSGATKYLLPGVSAKIHFNTGNLAGYEFDVHSYDHATTTFTVVKMKDDRSDEFPNASSAAFQFAVGDEYKLLDIALPDSYVTAAEADLATAGNNYYTQNSQPKVQYNLAVSEAYLKSMVGNGATVNIFMPGDYIPIKDSDIDVDKLIRISSLTRDLIDEYNYSLTISDTPVTANITNRVISQLIDIDNVIKLNKLGDSARAKRNWQSGQELMNMVFDPEGDYYTGKIKPNSIDTMALSVGAKSMQFCLSNTVIEANYNGYANAVKVAGGLLTHYTIQDAGTKTWTLTNYDSVLTGAAQGKTVDQTAYYIYARCRRSANDGYIAFLTDPVQAEADSRYYHFLVGILNSVDTSGVRAVSLMYGFSTINGRHIKTGRIESSGGAGSYIDLDSNKCKFGDNNTYLSYNENGDGKLVLKGTMVQSPSGEGAFVGVYRGSYNSATTYFNADEITFAGSTYRCTTSNPAGVVGIVPTNPMHWTVKAQCGANGANGTDGTDGADGADGEKGASPVYRGEYSNSVTYYGNSTRVDVVKYNGNYYVVKPYSGAIVGIPPTMTYSWASFGASFSSVATDLLLAENANIANFIFRNQLLTSQDSTGGNYNIQLDGNTGAGHLAAGNIAWDANGKAVIKGGISTSLDPNSGDNLTFRVDEERNKIVIEGTFGMTTLPIMELGYRRVGTYSVFYTLTGNITLYTMEVITDGGETFAAHTGKQIIEGGNFRYEELSYEGGVQHYKEVLNISANRLKVVNLNSINDIEGLDKGTLYQDDNGFVRIKRV